MPFSNNYGLPAPLFQALTRDTYSGPKDDPFSISVTGLIDSPMIRLGRMLHRDKIEEDASERVWTLLGHNVHALLESRVDTRNAFAEERVEIAAEDHRGREWTISGQADLLVEEDDGYVVYDWKVTSAWSLLFEGGLKENFYYQANLYAHLFRANGFDVKRACVIYILRDWSRAKARAGGDYPRIPLRVFHVAPQGYRLPDGEAGSRNDMLTDLQVREYMQTRLNLHAKALDMADVERGDLDGVPPCSRKERWAQLDTWAVYKNANKKAARVLESEDAAYRWIVQSGDGGDTYRVEHRPGRDTRCLDYCEVRPFCPYGAKLAQD